MYVPYAQNPPLTADLALVGTFEGLPSYRSEPPGLFRAPTAIGIWKVHQAPVGGRPPLHAAARQVKPYVSC